MSVPQGTVILLHGIGRTRSIMQRLEIALIAEGYIVYNINYPSLSYSIETLLEFLLEKIEPNLHAKSTLHFVGHSMGGILVRAILHKAYPVNLGRVVMIGTPNHGSLVADFMQRFTLFKKLWGPAFQQIGTNDCAFHHSLPPVNYDCGIIAGNHSIEFWFLFRGVENDGKVSVESTKLEGMKDFVVIPVSHSALPKHKQVIQFVKNFLFLGHF